MVRLALYALIAIGLAAPQAAQASPILSLMSEKGLSILEKISAPSDSGTPATLGDEDLQVIFGTGDLSDYRALKKRVKNKFQKYQARKRGGGSLARLRLKLDGSGLDLDGKLSGSELRRLRKDLKAMKGNFTVVTGPTGIPEPGTLALLGGGLGGLALANRRSRLGRLDRERRRSA
ncbi:MAG: PEP-CTERM sorting domain-containing protein [Myxococcota bacterium]